MIAEMANFIWELNIVLSFLVGLILIIRRPIKRFFSASMTYRCWVLVPFVFIAMVLFSTVQLVINHLPTDAMIVTSGAVQDMVAVLPEVVPSHRPTNRFQKFLAFTQGHIFAVLIMSIWVAGCVLYAVVFGIRQWSFYQLIGTLVPMNHQQYRSQTTKIGPVLVGVFRPKIVLPFDFQDRYDQQEQAMVIAHEQHHLKVSDSLINALFISLRCLFWFNPLIHIAARYARIDQEISCDAKVAMQFPKQNKRYAQLLLKTQLATQHPPVSCFWPASSKPVLTQRIKALKSSNDTIASSKKVTWLLTLSVVAATLMFNYVLLISPIGKGLNLGVPQLASSAEQALLVAASKGDIEAVNRLLRQGVNPNASIPPLGTPLIVAASKADLVIVKTLVNAGARVNDAARGQGFPLFAAAQTGDLEIVAYLLSKGAQINARVPEQDASPLSITAENGVVSMVKLLLDNGANPNMTVDDEGSPLIAAAAAGNLDVVRTLVSAGADITYQAPVERLSVLGRNDILENTSALEEARFFDKEEVIAFLETETYRQTAKTPP